ncbi:MAG: efflux RND transporter periplasmic adaptor subunit [Thermoanaerobaculia bacterium]
MSSGRSGREPSHAPQRLFRVAALEAYRRRGEEGGALLRNAPGWTRWTYWIMVAGAVALVCFGLFGRVSEYAAGPAVVRMAGRTEVTAPVAAAVRSVTVAPGESVERGQPLILFHGEREAAEARRLRALFEERLRQYLQDTAEPSAQAALIQARRELELAETRLQELTLRAPEDAVVGDIWVEVGEHLTPGRPVLSLESEAGGGEVIALLPGRYRPLLSPGQPLRLQIQGYPFHSQRLSVSAVNDQVLGPSEARQALGVTMRDGLPVAGPVVLVRARLPGDFFELAGRRVRYHNGMPGHAEVPVRSQRLLASLVPGFDTPPWRSGA